MFERSDSKRCGRASARLACATRSGLLACVWAVLLTACGERAGVPAPPAAPAATLQTGAAQASVLAYLQDAEIQAENDAQRRELRRALADLLDKPVSTLRAARYASPSGEPAQRDIAQLLRGHLVPGSPQSLDVDTLLAAKDSRDVQSALRDKLGAVDLSLSAGTDTKK